MSFNDVQQKNSKNSACSVLSSVCRKCVFERRVGEEYGIPRLKNLLPYKLSRSWRKTWMTRFGLQAKSGQWMDGTRTIQWRGGLVLVVTEPGSSLLAASWDTMARESKKPTISWTLKSLSPLNLRIPGYDNYIQPIVRKKLFKSHVAAVPSVSVKLASPPSFFSGAYQKSNEAYGKDWKIMGVPGPQWPRSLSGWMSSPHHPQGPRETPGADRRCLARRTALQSDHRRWMVRNISSNHGYYFLGVSEQMCFLPPFFAHILVIWVANSNNKNIYHLKSSNIHPFIIVFDHFSGSQELWRNYKVRYLSMEATHQLGEYWVPPLIRPNP